MLEILFIFLGAICAILGLAGCIVPIIPGLPLSYTALLILQYAREEPVFSASFLINFAIYTTLVFVLEYTLPLMGAKLYGISRRGMWGAFFGMLIGIFFFSPLGLVFGIFFGAIIGELTAGKNSSMALKAGLVTFTGSIFAILIKLTLSSVMAFHFFISLFKN